MNRPKKVSVEEFTSMLSEMEKKKEFFIQDMNAVGLPGTYPEVWISIYLSWLDKPELQPHLERHI